MTALVLALLLAAPTAGTPNLARVAVVDNSPSMAGERIAVVRDELSRVVEQLPPSVEFPLILVVFHGSVDPTQVFTDAAAAKQAIAKLTGNGSGTRIAPALVRAVEELRRFQRVGNVLVLLYTDGEDGDRDGIRRAEEQLDQIFADRGRRGLSQTVFVKRWGGANAALVQRIRGRGNAQVLDAGELQIEPITIDPRVAIVNVVRDSRDRRRVHIAYQPSFAVRGNKKISSALALQFRCLNAGAAGQTTTQAQAGAAAQAQTIVLPVPAEAEKSGRLELKFLVSPPASSPNQKTFLLPLLPSSVVTATVTLPPFILLNRLAATLENVAAVGWADPLALRVRCRAELVVTVAATDKETRAERSMRLGIVPAGTIQLRATNSTIDIRRPGTFRIPLAIEVNLMDSPVARPARTNPVELKLAVVSAAQHVDCQPRELLVQHAGVAPPGRVVTTITPTVRRIGPPRWIDLVEPLAAFEAEVAFDVAGPIPHSTTLTLVAPAAVRNSVLPPNTILRSGQNIVPLHVHAHLLPSRFQRLDFTILQPSPTRALEFRIASGFSLPVSGPAPVMLAHLHDGQPATHIDALLADNQDSLFVTLQPVPWGADLDQLRRAPQALAYARDKSSIINVSPTPLFAPHKVQLQVPSPTAQPFFLDVMQSIELELRPAESAPAVKPGRVTVAVVRQAPFKRLAAYLAWAIFPVGILFILVRIVRRLRDAPHV